MVGPNQLGVALTVLYIVVLGNMSLSLRAHAQLECPDGDPQGDGGENNPEVEVEQGTLRGKQVSEYGQRWEEYLGIPYAAPPTGSLRWKKPQPPQAWDGTRDATEFAPICPQEQIQDVRVSTSGMPSEDCLSLNIYVPGGVKCIRDLGLPVMVFIHGGLFVRGASSIYPGSHLALHGSVIVVTINYRVGAFGFITTLDQEAPGNYGLWDQNLALKWIKKNIGQFGGDSGRSTIFGQSAGGCSVSMHMLSPHSEGLFQGVIAQSGTAYAPFVFKPGQLAATQDMAEQLNCPTNNTTLMMNCLRQQDMDALVDATNTENPLSPVLDGDFFPVNLTDNDVFALTESPKVPMLVGSLHHDGAEFINFGNVVQFPVAWRLFVGGVTEWYYRNPDAVAAASEYVYLNETVKEDEDLMKMSGINFMTDALFRGPAVKIARDFTKIGGRSYLYSLRHHYSESIAPPHVEGIHGDDIIYMFGLQYEKSMTRGEIKLSEDMMTYWTNFAHSGDPNKPTPVSVEWPQFSIDSQEYIQLGVLDITVRDSFDRPGQLNFWTDVVPAIEGPATSEFKLDFTVLASFDGNGNHETVSGGTGGNIHEQEAELDDLYDDDDNDYLKRVVVIAACLAGGSTLLSLIILCCLCNIMVKLSGKTAVDTQL